MKKIIINIITKILLLVLLLISVLINKDYAIIKDRIYIHNKQTLNKYKDYKFVTLNLSNASETRFAINDNNKLNSIIYVVSYSDSNVLVELSKSTVLTDKVSVIYNKDNDITLLLKEDIIKENELDSKFIKGYYTNINLEENEKIIRLKYVITLILGCFILFTFLLDLLLIVSKKR